MPTQPPSPSRRRPRWWPAAAILALAALVWIWIWWLRDADSRQERVMLTLMLGAATLLLLMVWLLFLSRLRWPVRLGVFLAVVAFVASLELRGFSGDVAPYFAFRWTPKPDETLATDVERRAGSVSRAPDAGDFSQFLGPERNATVSGVALDPDWQARPPEELWRQPIGAGHSGFAVVGGVAVTHEQRGEQEMVVAYDLESGETLWAHGVETRHEDPLGGAGPRATPAIASGSVYALGATGVLSVLDLETGRERWSRNVLDDAGAAAPGYGVSGSPLVLVGAPPDEPAPADAAIDDAPADGAAPASAAADGAATGPARDDLVIVAAGGDGRALIAYDRASGEIAWAGGSYSAAYASPSLATLADVPQIVVFHQSGIVGQAFGGEELWRTGWSGSEVTSQPVPLPGDRLFASSGYGVGGKMYRISRSGGGDFDVELLWESNKLKAKLTQVVYRDGYLYGLDDGILACVDAETGERVWKRGRYGHGQILLAGDKIVISGEKGDVALAEASPDGYVEHGRFQAIEGRTWNTPALAGPYLLVRNSEEAACYKLPTL